MNTKPIIGISAMSMIDTSMRFKNYRKACVNEDYVASVLKAGGVPLILPVIEDTTLVCSQLQAIDGIIFSGGLDIDPTYYDQTLLEKCGPLDRKRDRFDIALFRAAKKLKKPTLAICKGHQISCVAQGGSLYQDLSYFPNDTLKHDQFSTPDFKAHSVTIQEDSLLFEILQKKELMTNSFHHQIIKDLPQEFRVVGSTSDGVIEAVEYKNPDYFFLSLQWHPEMMAARNDADMLKIFRRFIQESYNNQRSKS